MVVLSTNAENATIDSGRSSRGDGASSNCFSTSMTKCACPKFSSNLEGTRFLQKFEEIQNLWHYERGATKVASRTLLHQRAFFSFPGWNSDRYVLTLLQLHEIHPHQGNQCHSQSPLVTTCFLQF